MTSLSSKSVHFVIALFLGSVLRSAGNISVAKKLARAIFFVIILFFGSNSLVAGDISAGKKLARQCKACHTFDEGGRNKLGPNLFNILEKSAATVKGYKYSKALKSSGLIWDEATFLDFITKPKKIVKGTKMSYRGLKKATQRSDLLAYFQTLRKIDGRVGDGGNIERGQAFTAKYCAVCHSFERGGKLVYGPNLFGIYGKPAGTINGYAYSKALKDSGLTWTDKNLIGFMSAPEQFLKGTIARFPGLKSTKQRADIIAYIKTLK